MAFPIDPALGEYETLAHIVADLDDPDAAGPAPLQWTVRATRRASTRSRVLANAARAIAAALAVLLLLVAVGCGETTSPARTPAPAVSVSFSPAMQMLTAGERHR